jgi:hypothetical protein
MDERAKAFEEVLEILDATPDINYNVHVLRQHLRSSQ